MQSTEWKIAGQWLREKRKKQGLSQAKVAAALGLDHSIVSGIENGHRRVQAKAMHQYADVLGANRTSFSRRMLKHYYPDLHRSLWPLSSTG